MGTVHSSILPFCCWLLEIIVNVLCGKVTSDIVFLNHLVSYQAAAVDYCSVKKYLCPLFVRSAYFYRSTEGSKRKEQMSEWEKETELWRSHWLAFFYQTCFLLGLLGSSHSWRGVCTCPQCWSHEIPTLKSWIQVSTNFECAEEGKEEILHQISMKHVIYIYLEMFSCNFCCNSVKSLGEYVLRCKPNWNEPHSLFKRIAAGCKQKFFGAFKAHFYRRHDVSAPITVFVCTAVTNFKCAFALCEHQCQTTKALTAH